MFLFSQNFTISNFCIWFPTINFFRICILPLAEMRKFVFQLGIEQTFSDLLNFSQDKAIQASVEIFYRNIFFNKKLKKIFLLISQIRQNIVEIWTAKVVKHMILKSSSQAELFNPIKFISEIIEVEIWKGLTNRG